MTNLFNRLLLVLAVWLTPLATMALEPCSYTEFYDNISYSPDIQPGVWNGRSDLCLKKARETGWLMLWFLAAREDNQDCKDFLRSNICNQPFCDIVNNYKYLILCCDDYGSTASKNLKNLIYGYPEPKTILNENTGEMEENHRGYPIHTIVGWDSEGEAVYDWCDYPPSLHLFKIDDKTNIIFHVCKREGVYETEVSPYASQFPIPSNMNVSMNLFGPWLKQYLDMYPVADQIEEYENSGTGSSSVITNTTYEQVEVAVTETINPTIYQMALHRDNILFRSVTVLRDILVKKRIGDDFSDFDGRVSVKNSDGKWYINHDDTMSSIQSSVSDSTSIDVYPNVGCTFKANQRFGNGFTISGYSPYVSTTISTQKVVRETGVYASVVTTNDLVQLPESPFMSANVGRNTLFSTNLISGKIYRIKTPGNATFDVFSTK